MSKKSQANKKLKKAGVPPATGSNARERARLQAQEEKRKKDRLTLIVVALVVVAVVIAGGIGISWFQSTRTPDANPGTGNEYAQNLIVNQPVVFGEQDAPNTIAVYLDFRCPHCIDFEAEFGDLIDKAIDSGEWKNEVWPMSFLGPSSVTMANAFGCSVESGFGRSYQRGLFQDSALEWNNSQLLALGEQVNGSIPTSFNSCVQNMGKSEWVSSIGATAQANGVQGTPTVHINGENYDLGGVTREQFAADLGVQP